MSGVKNVGSAMVHTGFQFAYAVTQSTVLNAVKAQLASNPSYRVVVTGHSLGAAVAALAAVSIKSTFPNVNLQLYTYGICALIKSSVKLCSSFVFLGQPRTGNAAFASYVENLIGTANIFRAVHTFGFWFLLKNFGSLLTIGPFCRRCTNYFTPSPGIPPLVSRLS